MDTGTHVVMGIALCSLATLDSNVIANDATTTAVFSCIMFGSQAPDIDTLLKFKNNASYIKNHRGFTHSIIAQLSWPLLIAAFFNSLFLAPNFFTLWIWAQLAVSFHILVDLFNAYGTQALRPFSKKWIAFGIINTFDPIIFSLHIIGLIFITFGYQPGYTFIIIYFLLVIYYLIRIFYHYLIKKKIFKYDPTAKKIVTMPTIRFFTFKFVYSNEHSYYVGEIRYLNIKIVDTFKQQSLPRDLMIVTAQTDKNIQVFLSFSPMYRWEVKEINEKRELRLIDLRYRHRTHYPFVAVITFDSSYHVLNSYIGWIFSEEKLQRKLQKNNKRQ